MTDEEFLQQVVDYRRERNKERRKDVMTRIGAAAESFRTGESYVNVRDRWRPDYSDRTLTASEKAKYRQDALDTLKDVESQRLDAQEQQASNILEALKAQLRSLNQKYGDDVSAAAQNTRNNIRVLEEQIGRAQQEMEEGRKVDEASEERLTSYLKARSDVAEGEARRLQAMSLGDLETMYTQKLLARGVPPDEARAGGAKMAVEVKQADPDQLSETMVSAGGAGLVPGEEDLIRGLVTDVLAPDVPPEQAINLLGGVSAKTGVPMEELVTKVTGGNPDFRSAFQKKRQAVRKARDDAKGRKIASLQALAQQMNRVGADSRELRAVQQQLHQHIEEMKRGNPLSDIHTEVERGTRATGAAADEAQAMARQGAASMQTVEREYEETPERRKFMEMRNTTDPAEQAVKTIEYIEEFPDSSPAQELWKGISSSDKYAQWKKERGYEGFDDRLVRKELLREAWTKHKREKDKFKRRVQQNRIEGLSPMDTDSSTVVAGSDRATRSEEEPRGQR